MISKEELDSLIWTVGTSCPNSALGQLRTLVAEYVNLRDIVEEIHRISKVAGVGRKILRVESQKQNDSGTEYSHADSDYRLVQRIEKAIQEMEKEQL